MFMQQLLLIYPNKIRKCCGVLISKAKTETSLKFLNFRLALLTKALIAVSVFATHALSCFVAIDIIWSEYVSKRVENSTRKVLLEYVLRTVVVFITCKYLHYFKMHIGRFDKWQIIYVGLIEWQKNFIQFVVIMAMAIPDLDLFVSLIGALSLATLGVMFPPMLEIVAKWNHVSSRVKAILIFKTASIGLVGLAGFVIGTSISLKDIIVKYTHES